MEIKEALKELRSEKKRKFTQTVDLIVNLKNFEGLLAANDLKTKWMIAFNESIASKERIRFTKAHELGHYMLHRNTRAELSWALFHQKLSRRPISLEKSFSSAMSCLVL